MKFVGVLLLSFFSLLYAAQTPLDPLAIPSAHEQVVLVTSPSWSSTVGTLSRFERVDGKWKKVGEEVPIVLGKSGMAWGNGLHKNPTSATLKKEGDGKAPAGIFRLGTLFGYQATFSNSFNYPYRQATNRDYFIDDQNSSDYNQWKTISPDQENVPKNYWASYERMKRSDHLYELGIVVEHNMNPAIKGNGSAIFMHVWREASSSTLGCTAMSKENINTLMTWLNPSKNPILIQVPSDQLKDIRF